MEVKQMKVRYRVHYYNLFTLRKGNITFQEIGQASAYIKQKENFLHILGVVELVGRKVFRLLDESEYRGIRATVI